MQKFVFAAAGEVVADISQDPWGKSLSAMGREEGKEGVWVLRARLAGSWLLWTIL